MILSTKNKNVQMIPQVKWINALSISAISKPNNSIIKYAKPYDGIILAPNYHYS